MLFSNKVMYRTDAEHANTTHVLHIILPLSALYSQIDAAVSPIVSHQYWIYVLYKKKPKKKKTTASSHITF